MARPPKPLPPSKESFVDQTQMASILGVNVSSITRWLKEADPMPTVEQAGKVMYPVSKCVHWWKNREVKAALPKLDTPDLNESKARKEAALAESAEWDLAEKKGILIDRGVALAMFEAKLANIVNKLSQLGGNKYAPHFLNLDTLPDAQIKLKWLGATLRDEIVAEEGSDSSHDSHV